MKDGIIIVIIIDCSTVCGSFAFSFSIIVILSLVIVGH